MGLRVMEVCRVEEMMRRTGAMTCWTVSMACVPMSMSAPAPAVSLAYRQLYGASGEAP